MNYIPKNGISSENERQYAEIRSRYEVGHLKEIYEDLKDMPLIKFKDSMKNRLCKGGLPHLLECLPKSGSPARK